jgi:hypothetical protein
VDYLSRTGVRAEFPRLADHGLHGNGHMMMLEKNTPAIAALLGEWLTARLADA